MRKKLKTVTEGWVPRTHGIPSSYNRGCRCDPCCEVNRGKQREWRLKTYGARVRPTVEQRFHPKVDVRGPDECWPWTRSRFRYGYGCFRMDGRMRRAHVVAWEFANGRRVLPGGVIRHTCDNPPCCNPRHLLVGTQLDNIADRGARGRTQRSPGERNHRARLTEDQVRWIKGLHATPEWPGSARVGGQLGVSRCTINDIIKGRNWTHV